MPRAALDPRISAAQFCQPMRQVEIPEMKILFYLLVDDFSVGVWPDSFSFFLFSPVF
jgi:hypothetical protein